MTATYAARQGKQTSRMMKSTRRKLLARKRFRLFLLLAAVVLVILFFTMNTRITSASSENLSERSKYYTCIYVDYGDTLWEIAGKYAGPEYADYYAYIDEVVQINHLGSTDLKTGMNLCVPYYAEEPGC